MSEIVLYTTHCKNCKVLEKKLNEKNIGFTANTDMAEMRKLGMLSAPGLMVDDRLMGFGEAIEWVNGR